MNPKVTIIIPTYNRADLLPQALESALIQDFTDYEILVLDDASIDNTHEIILPYLKDNRIRYIKHPKNIGINSNRNYGLSVAKGEYIAMLDSDDTWISNTKLKRQKEILDMHPDIALVGTYCSIINTKNEKLGEIRTHSADSSIRKNMMIINQFVQSSVLIRKQVLDQIGYYDNNIPIWEDYELWLRIGEKFRLMNISELLTGYRVHAGNISKLSEQKCIKSYSMIYKLYKNKYPNSWVLLSKIWVKKLIFNLKHFS